MNYVTHSQLVRDFRALGVQTGDTVGYDFGKRLTVYLTELCEQMSYELVVMPSY
jgi:hypothetical protein